MPQLRLQFAAEAAWYSPIIRWFTHSAYSHVDILADDGSLIGARPFGGVARRPAGYMPFTAVKIVTVPMSDAGYAAAMAFLDRQVGKPYDFTSFGGFIFGRDWRDDDSWFCSEIAAAVLEQGGVFPHKLCLANTKIAPADLLLVLSALFPVD